MTKLTGIVGALLLVGCGGGSSPEGSGGGAISSAPLAGKLGGAAWTLGTAESDSFLSSDQSLAVNAYSASFTPCTDSAPSDGSYLILTLPKTVGTHSLSLNLNETFYVGNGDNLVAISGTIVIDSVTATTISGGARFAYNADNSVDGQFTATICP